LSHTENLLIEDAFLGHEVVRSSFWPRALMVLMILAIGIAVGWNLRAWYAENKIVPPAATLPAATTATKCTQSQTRYTYWRQSPRFVPLAEHEQGCWELAR